MSDSAMIVCAAEMNERTFAAFIESLGGSASAGKPSRGSISQDEGDLYLGLLTVEQWADFYAEQDVFEWAEHLGGAASEPDRNPVRAHPWFQGAL
ncbi:hypothetical protein [Pseudomonas sp. 1152_12]|uniref:hypothetical protein n=1 Tax=Pseudomonas sp. 1152_12 TaxID=2604455 RepID=UPI0040643628